MAVVIYVVRVLLLSFWGIFFWIRLGIKVVLEEYSRVKVETSLAFPALFIRTFTVSESFRKLYLVVGGYILVVFMVNLDFFGALLIDFLAHFSLAMVAFLQHRAGSYPTGVEDIISFSGKIFTSRVISSVAGTIGAMVTGGFNVS